VHPWKYHDVYGGAPLGDFYFYPQWGETATYMDFTLPPGSGGRMDLWIESDDPNATVYLGAPNEVFGIGTYDNFGALNTNTYGAPANLGWSETVSPHHTVINYSTSAGFDFCGTATDLVNFNGFCSSSPNYWGNMDVISVVTTAPTHVFFGAPPNVPEPMSWMLMLIGFFSLGGALRSQRSTRLSADGQSACRLVPSR
jgi:hypothetical protein